MIYAFIGIGYDREFNEPNFFIKHKPSIKLIFKSTTMESDQDLNSLSLTDKQNEMLYRKFYENSPIKRYHLNAVTFIIPLMFSLLNIGLLAIKLNQKQTVKQFSFLLTMNFLILLLLEVIHWNLRWDYQYLLALHGIISFSIAYKVLKKHK